jgi:hypothetical protein
MPKRTISQECWEVLDLMEQFIKETTTPLNDIDLWDIVNNYFSLWKTGIVYLNLSNGKCNLWTHSTLDITNPRNIVVYFRTVFKNKLKQNENPKPIWLN